MDHQKRDFLSLLFTAAVAASDRPIRARRHRASDRAEGQGRLTRYRIR